MLRLFFFFFKQKTAYEMRISDWSSDVCSSDLMLDIQPRSTFGPVDFAAMGRAMGARGYRAETLEEARVALRDAWQGQGPAVIDILTSDDASPSVDWGRLDTRSEEHTSELPSLMRISYAVFCLKQKTKQSI